MGIAMQDLLHLTWKSLARDVSDLAVSYNDLILRLE
jgi:hypothetical protein